MKHTTLPTISIVIATRNSARTIERCLTSIRQQRYPKERVEILVADGASTDETHAIAKRFGVRWIAVDPSQQSAEYNKAVGISHARNEIIAMIDHDNVLSHAGWMTRMVEPFLEHEDVVGVESYRYQYDANGTILDRYFALFGAGDPIVWYLGKADRLSYITDTFPARWGVADHGAYGIVRFREDAMPTIGANGFLVRRILLFEHALIQPGQYFDMDVNIDLIRKGYGTYAYVKDTILHLTGYGDVWSFLKRRTLFLHQYHLGEAGLAMHPARRYHVFTKKDIPRLLVVILLCLTIIIPLYDSFRGFRKIRDRAWFLHPFLCVAFVILYSYAVLRHAVFSYGKKYLAR